jgi:hypothetical protein
MPPPDSIPNMEVEMIGNEKDWPTKLGSLLIALGVSVWALYAVMRWGLGRPVELSQFLPYHLCGVIPGSLLKYRRFLTKLVRRASG